MHEHFNLSEEAYRSLIKSGVTDLDFLRAVPFFDPIGSGLPLTKVNLFYYLDEKGPWDSKPLFPHKKIAKAFYESFDWNEKEQFQILLYKDFIEEGDEE